MTEFSETRAHAIVAQSVERIHGKDEVPGSIPGDGSRAGRWRHRSGLNAEGVGEPAGSPWRRAGNAVENRGFSTRSGEIPGDGSEVKRRRRRKKQPALLLSGIENQSVSLSTRGRAGCRYERSELRT